MRQIDIVLAAYRDGGCRTTKEVPAHTGMPLKTCSAYTSVLAMEGKLLTTRTLSRWSKRGALPFERKHNERKHKSVLLDERMPWPQEYFSVDKEIALRKTAL